MKISIISGSQRAQSQSLKVANYIFEYLNSQNLESKVVDLFELNLPLKGLNSVSDINSTDILHNHLDGTDALVIVCPEWNGSVTPVLTNFFLHLGNFLAHRPVLLVSVSSGRGGAFIISSLRANSYKNTLLNYIPEHIIIRDVKNMLNSKQGTMPEDIYIQKRIKFALNLLVEYSKALETIYLKDNTFAESSSGMS